MMQLRRRQARTTCTSPTASTTSANVGNRYIVNPPGADVRIPPSTTRSATARSPGTSYFGTLRDVGFDGIATVCVFGWEEQADEIHTRMLERVSAELAG